MTRLRSVFVLNLMWLLLGPLQIVLGQSVMITNSDWTTLQEEFQNLRIFSEKLNKQVTALNQSLTEARISQENSTVIISALQTSLNQAEQTQVSLEMKIADLETSLIKAGNLGIDLEAQLLKLRKQLTALKTLLEDTRNQLELNSNKHEQAIINMATDYEVEIKKLRTQRNIALVLCVLEIAIIGICIYLAD